MKRKKGFIIITALVIAASLTAMVGVYSLSVFYRIQMYSRLINSTRAYYLAGAGINYGRGRYKEGTTDETPCEHKFWDSLKGEWIGIPQDATFSLSDSGNSVTVEFDTVESIAVVRSSAKVGSVTRSAVCELQCVPGYPNPLPSPEFQLLTVKWKFEHE